MNKKIGELDVQVIDTGPGSEKVRVSFGIRAGYAMRNYGRVQGLHIEETSFNTAASFVFGNYLRQQYRLETGKEASVRCFNNVMTVTIETEPAAFSRDFTALSRSWFQKNIAEPLIQSAYQAFRSWFQEQYQNVAFRSRLNMYEFTEQAKAFSAAAFLEDVDHFTVADFRTFVTQLVHSGNTSVAVLGEEAALLPQLAALDPSGFPAPAAKPLHPVRTPEDPSAVEDRFLWKEDAEFYAEGSLRVDLLDRSLTNEDLFVFTQVIARCLFQQDFQVAVDCFEAAVFYFNRDLNEFKEDLKGHLNKANILEAATRYAQELENLFREQSELFLQYFVYLAANEIHFFEAVEKIRSLTAENLLSVLPYIRISECHFQTKVKGVGSK